jgi:putative ABC transport system permease protein
MSEWWARLRFFLLRKKRGEMDEELRFHVEQATAAKMRAGLSEAEARRQALVEFGGVERTRAECERQRPGWWLETVARDVRYALRGMRRARGYTAALVGTLALGLGSVTAMLAVVECVLVRPMALPHPDELMQVYANREQEGMSASQRPLPYKQIDALRQGASRLAGVGAYNLTVRPVGTAEGERISVLTEVSPDLFTTLGMRAKMGRLIAAGDAGAPVAVVNDAFWRERMHADPKAVGETIRISGKTETVIGVLPEGEHFPELVSVSDAEAFVPIAVNAKGEDEYGIETAAVVVRLKPGVTRQQGLAEAESVFVHADPKYAANHGQLEMRPYQQQVTGGVEKPLLALLGGVLVLLLIACANAANLQIGRAASRMPEMAVRAALGASYGRLLQQLVTESVLAALGSAALGGAVAYGAVKLVRHAYGTQYARFDELTVRPVVLLAAAGLAVLVGVVSALAPAVGMRRQTAARAMARQTTRRSRLPGALVALQVALTCVLLATSGLFVRTMQSLENVKLGFDPKDVTTLVLMPEDQHQDPQVSREMETRLLRRFETMPGVQSVTMQTSVPFSSYQMSLHGTTDVDGRVYQKGDMAYYSMVSTGFTRTSGIRLLEGRGFEASDENSGTIAAVVNQAFVKEYLSGRDPVGSVVRFHRDAGDKDADLPFLEPMNVVGVVENEVQGGDLGAPYEPMVYIDYLQLPKNSFLGQVFTMGAQYAVRSQLAQGALDAELRAVVKQEAPTMVEMSLKPMKDSIAESLGERRLGLRLVAGFGVVALVLAAVGLYGVLAYSVARRRREIGIRMALGSSREQAAGLVMRQATAMVGLGLIPGLVGAWAAGRAVRAFLYGVQPLDGVALGGAGFLLLLVGALAAALPALRAAQVDPAETLRAE